MFNLLIDLLVIMLVRSEQVSFNRSSNSIWILAPGNTVFHISQSLPWGRHLHRWVLVLK